MGLETATYINQLVTANPVGGVDNYSTADDHIRLVKGVMFNSFPNVGGAVLATHLELSFVSGVTSAIQTQLAARELLANKNVNNGYAGLNSTAQLNNAQVSAANVTQHQGSIAIAGSQVTSGSIPDARVPLSNVSQHQGSLAFSAAQLTSGSMPDARVPLTNVSQHQSNLAIAASQLTGLMPDARIQQSNVTQHQASLAIAGSQLNSAVPSARVTALDSACTIDGESVGYRNILRRTSGWARGECLAVSAGVTLNTSDMATGRALSVYNDSGSAVVITQGAGVTLRLGGTATSGSRTLAARGLATIWCNSATEGVMTGSGVS